jgi:hypothetical protein
MKTARTSRLLLCASLSVVTMMLSMAPNGSAQSLPADSRRIDQLRRDVQTELRRADEQSATTSARLRVQLEDLRDEVGYLSTLQRRGERIEEQEYRQLETRLQTIRQELRATAGAPTGSRPNNRTGIRLGSGEYEIPVGTELDVRLQEELSSETAMVEDRFETTTAVDFFDGDRLVVPAGSVVRGVVSAVDPATRVDRRGSLTVTFDELTTNGRTYAIRASVVEALEAGVSGEVGRIGAGAGIGAILGGILGGTKGAIAGILIGAGGTVLATDGNDVDLPVGTVMRLRFDSPVRVATRAR